MSSTIPISRTALLENMRASLIEMEADLARLHDELLPPETPANPAYSMYARAYLRNAHDAAVIAFNNLQRLEKHLQTIDKSLTQLVEEKGKQS